MEFRTPIHLTPSDFRLNIQSRILTLGSCFAEVMGNRLSDHKLQVLINPFGTLFNPISLARVVSLAIDQGTVSTDRLVQNHGYWYHYDFHSRLSSATSSDLLQKIQLTIQDTSNFLRTADCLIITLGTAVAYRLRHDKQVVANCHKVSATTFEHTLLSLPEVLHPLETLFSQLFQIRPDLRIILTVSPVRHIKDTLQVNSISKALLRLACHVLTTQFPLVSYFPAFEILIDDLRDYRFYKTDMIHPSETAEEYIWQHFIQTYLDEPTQKFLQQWVKIKQGLNHRPLQENSPAHQQFLESLEQKLLSLSVSIDVSTELTEVRNRIQSSKS